MVNEHILCAVDSQAELLYASAIVIIFEETTAKDFIQRADGFIGLAREHHTEESCGMNVLHFADMAMGVLRRFQQHFVHVLVADLDLGFVTDIVGNRAENTNGLVALKVAIKCADPARSDKGVVIEQYQVFTGCYGQPLVVARSESTIVIVQNDFAVRCLTYPLFQQSWRAIGRRIVDDNDFEIFMIGVLVQASEARLGEFNIVVRHHDDTDARYRPVEFDPFDHLLGAMTPGLVSGELLARLYPLCWVDGVQFLIDRIDECFGRRCRMHQVFKLLDFRQIHGHDRFSGAQVLINLDGVGCQRKWNDLKR